METVVILKTIFLFITLWGLALCFLIFRPRISAVWKVAAFMLYGFYIWFFREEILSGYSQLVGDWFPTIVLFLKEVIFLIFYLLFVFWPVALVIIFYKSDDLGAEHLLKFMVVFTLAVWIGIVFYSFTKKGIDQFLFQKLIHLLPFTN